MAIAFSHINSSGPQKLDSTISAASSYAATLAASW